MPEPTTARRQVYARRRPGNTNDMLRLLDFLLFPGVRRARARSKLAYRMLQSIVVLQRAPTER